MLTSHGWFKSDTLPSKHAEEKGTIYWEFLNFEPPWPATSSCWFIPSASCHAVELYWEPPEADSELHRAQHLGPRIPWIAICKLWLQTRSHFWSLPKAIGGLRVGRWPNTAWKQPPIASSKACVSQQGAVGCPRCKSHPQLEKCCTRGWGSSWLCTSLMGRKKLDRATHTNLFA